MDKNTPAKNPDAVWGAAEIGAVIGRTERQASYLLERGLLPAKRIGGRVVNGVMRGGRWVASRKALLAALGLNEGGEAA